MLHELMELHLEMVRRAVAGIINQVNGPGSGHDVDGGSKYQESRANDYTDEVVVEMEPQQVNVFRVHLGGLDNDDGH